jgi:hypothetical protein
MLGVLFTLPDATSSLAAIGAYSSPILTDFLPLFNLIAGFGLPIVVVLLAVAALAYLVRVLTHHG